MAKSFAEAVVAEWSSEATADAWRRWHSKVVGHLGALTEAMMDMAEAAPGMRVLDLASGSGEPAMTLARAVGEAGHVTVSDFSPHMLAVAKENAGVAGMSNMDFREADAQNLPFEDEGFDRVTCRLGLMYVPDANAALKGARRVLKPGGRVVHLVWGAREDNMLARTVMGPFAKRKPPPAPPPGAPDPQRYAKPGSLAAEMERAGFLDVVEKRLTLPVPWEGPPEELWRHVFEVAVPIRTFVSTFEPDERDAAVAEVLEAFARVYDGAVTRPEVGVAVAMGVR